jgi:hypothetical protein
VSRQREDGVTIPAERVGREGRWIIREWTDFQTPRGRGDMMRRHKMLCRGIAGRTVLIQKPFWWFGPTVVARPR